MIAKRQFILTSLVILSLLLLVGCYSNVSFESKRDFNNQSQNDCGNYDSENENEKIITITTKNKDEMINTMNKDKTDSEIKDESDIEIFGTWNLDKVVLKSEAYDGTSKEALGGIDEEDYVGLKLEFTDKYLRLGEEKFSNPEYTLEYITVAEYNDGGKYKEPDIYDVIENESIIVQNSDQYEWLSEVPLKYYEVTFKEDYFIPVGTQVVMLNNDTMLVGIWGKIIFSHRIK